MRQTKSADRILPIIFVVLLFVTVLLPIQEVGIISDIGVEDIYWERARFLLGQGGISLYNGSSMCSLGYSLLLMPICAIIKSPYAAYKAAILLNGVFLCGSYVVSVWTVNRLLREKKAVLSIVCFFAVVMPTLAADKMFTGPVMVTLFLVWVCLYALVRVWEKYECHWFWILTVCLILVGFFQISLLGVIAGVLLAEGILVKQKKLNDTVFLQGILALLVGLAAGNVAERVLLSAFTKELDVSVTSSLEVFFNGISVGWKNGYVGGLLSGLAGKLYSMSINTLLVILPGLWHLIHIAVQWKKDNEKEECQGVFTGLLLITAAQMLLIILYDNSQNAENGLISLQGLIPIITLLAMIGIIQIMRSRYWARELTAYLLILCGSTFFTAKVYQKNGITEISARNSGALVLFQQGDVQVIPAVYMAACFVMLFAIVLWGSLGTEWKKKWTSCMLQSASVILAVVLCGISYIGIFNKTAGKLYKNSYHDVGSVASVLAETGAENEYYYFIGSGADKDAVMLQSLLPDKKIQMIPYDRTEWERFYEQKNQNPFHTVVLTGTGVGWTDEMEENLLSFRADYLTKNLAVWSSVNDEKLHSQIEETVSKRLEKPGRATVESGEADFLLEEPLTEISTETETTEKTEDTSETENDSEESESESQTETEEAVENVKVHRYQYENLLLAPGTYRLELYFRAERYADLSGMVQVSDLNGLLAETEFDKQCFDEMGNGSLGIEFTGDEIMRLVSIEIESSTSMEIENIYYWKLSGGCDEGLNDESALNQISKVIKSLDEISGMKGSVVFAADQERDSRDIWMRSFEDQLENYEISAVIKGGLTDVNAEYLIGDTAAHAYFDVMDRYSIIHRGEEFTVLVRNDSIQYQTYVEQYGGTLSHDRTISMTAFSKKSAEEIEKIKLESGNYRYHLLVGYEEENLLGSEDAVAGTIYIKAGSETVGQLTVRNKDIFSGTNGEVELAVPFILRVGSQKVSFHIELEAARELTVMPVAVELVTEKYRYGEEESMLKPVLDMVNRMGEEIDLYLVLSKETYQKGQFEDSYLQETLPDCQVDTITYQDAYALTEDALLLTRSLSTSYMKLAGLYTIIGHAGQYTLWARSDGQYLQRALEAGATIESSGKKISMETLKAAGNIEFDSEKQVLSYLPRGKYTITLKLTAEDLDMDDKVEITLLRGKSESELESELEELMESGFTEEEALEEIETQEECGNATLEAYQFEGKDSMMVTVGISGTRIWRELSFDVYSWHGNEVSGEMVWVEMV